MQLASQYDRHQRINALIKQQPSNYNQQFINGSNSNNPINVGAFPLDKQQRSKSNQSRESVCSTDSRSTAASKSSQLPSSAPPKPSPSCSSQPPLPNSSYSKGNSESYQTHGNMNYQSSPKMNENKNLHSSSNSMYSMHGEQSKHRFGIDPNKSSSSSCSGNSRNNNNRHSPPYYPVTNSNSSNGRSAQTPAFNHERRQRNNSSHPHHYRHQHNNPPTPYNLNHSSPPTAPQSPSPCSTCSSSSSPEGNWRLDARPPLSAAAANARPSSDITNLNSSNNNNPLTAATTTDRVDCFDASSPSAFSPFTLQTPAHPHQQQSNNLSNSAVYASLTCPASAQQLLLAAGFTDSQARTRQDANPGSSSQQQQTVARRANNQQQMPSNGINSSACSIRSGASQCLDGSCARKVRYSCPESQLMGAAEAAGAPGLCNGRMPLITPVKTGKKVQYRKTKACPWNQHGRCVMGDSCNYAHTKTELRGRPDLTRTRLCPDVETCTKTNCRFAHDVSQLRATGAFFRTKLCKFWQRGWCPSGAYCRHAHGEEQMRKPAAIGGNEKECESPREAILLSGLCSDNGSNSSSLVDEAQNSRTCTRQQLDDDNATMKHERQSSIKHDPELENDQSVTQKHKIADVKVDASEKTGKAEEMFGLSGCSSQPITDNTNTNQPQASSVMAGHYLSDDELTAAVSEYLFLSGDRGNNRSTRNFNSSNSTTSTSEFNSLLGTCSSGEATTTATSTAGDDDEINRLVKAFTNISNENVMSFETPFKDQLRRSSPSPSPPSTAQYNTRADALAATSFMRNDQPLIISPDNVASTPAPTFHHQQHSQQLLSDNLAASASTVTRQSLMFPSADVSCSAADLKLNDILNIAVASQDPDLLECSAKILRASIQYKKQQKEQQLVQQQQQQLQPTQQQPLPTAFLTQLSSVDPAAASSTSAVSSFPSSPRLTAGYSQQQQSSVFNPYASSSNQTFYL